MSRGASLAAVLLLACAARPAAADAGWFESGDVVLRNDLVLLNDAEVIRLPVNQWPIPRAAVRYAITHGKPQFAQNAAVAAALARVSARLDASPSGARGLSFDASASVGNAGLLRDFDTIAREDAELRGRATYAASERVEVALNVTAVAGPDDGDELRADGSHATLQLGNWLLSANTLDRWWGPSHESSLILSNNARPMPTLMVERAESRVFETPWLRWIGPWRFNLGFSQMENERQDIDAPLFMAWRIAIMPFKKVEVGFSRTAQFCGRQLECELSTFKNLLIGNDNVGIDATAENEPGNQMAGFDIRWNSPLFDWPYAIYGQAIGEDESSYVPAKYLVQYGVEAWKTQARGGLLQGFAEYSSTTCSANTGRGPYYNCSYNQGRFNVEGYRYKGRVIGHTVDNDTELYSIGGTYTREDGQLWSGVFRTARLNRGGSAPDVRDPVSSVPANYKAVELGWRSELLGGKVSIDLGAESYQADGGPRNIDGFGFVGWQYEPGH
jgi:hypothetical protein